MQRHRPLAVADPYAIDVLKRMTPRELTRLLMVTFGVVCVSLAIIIALPLLGARTERGVIKFDSTPVRGVPTNRPYVDWGVALRLETGDLPNPPKAGDSVKVLAIGKAGMLKSGRSFRRAWTWTGGFVVAGLALIIGGIYILRRQPLPHEIGVTQTV
jgi:hypothetical protein